MDTNASAAHAPIRVMTAGSVDDGKSTLIGRLLHDLDLIDDDVLADLREASRRRGRGELDLSLFTDGLAAEREQGITIDVAHRYFHLGDRGFVLADAPGHVQYTRNMVCAASRADCALLMIDARHGAVEQTHRHLSVAQWLGVRHVVFVVNKIDLVDYSEARFQELAAGLRSLVDRQQAESPRGSAGDREPTVHILPVSALDGDNIVHRSTHTPWYVGPTLLDVLTAIPAGQRFDTDAPARFPVQLVMRPTGHEAGAQWHDFRALSGRVDSGRLRVGDRLRVAGTGVNTAGDSGTTRIVRIHTFDGDLDEAVAGDSVSLVLEHDLDIARGEVLVHADDGATVTTALDVEVCWMAEAPARAGQKLLVRQGTRSVQARIGTVESLLDIETGRFGNVGEVQAPQPALTMNTIARLKLQLAEPLLDDAYSTLPRSGALILIDPVRLDTLAAAIVRH